jgi:hypothetical protein
MSRTGSIDATVDIRILKTANNLDDRIHFTDVAEKLIAEPFSSLALFTSPAMSTNRPR